MFTHDHKTMTQQGLEHRPLNLDSSALTIRPLRLSSLSLLHSYLKGGGIREDSLGVNSLHNCLFTKTLQIDGDYVSSTTIF